MERLTRESLSATHAPTSAPSAPVFRRGTEVAASSEAKVVKSGAASEKSVAFLRKLVAERYPSASEEYVAGIIAEGQKRVSVAIEKLLALPKVAPVATVPASRVNRYGGTCEECGTHVEPEAGVLTQSDEGKWEVAHKAGECPVSEYPFPVGRYAVEGAEGTRFYVASHEGFFVQAGDELHPVAHAAAKVLIEKIVEDPESASRLYGREIGRCGRCGRTLTTEESRAQGLGPVCASRGW